VSLSRCKGCGGEYRKGSIAVLFFQKGGSARTRVCPSCVKRGVLVVPELLAPVVKRVEKRSEAVEEAIRTLTTYMKAAQACADGTKDEDGFSGRVFQIGRVEGYESAIELLKKVGAP